MMIDMLHSASAFGVQRDGEYPLDDSDTVRPYDQPHK